MYVHFYTLEIRPTHHKMADEGNLSGNMQKKSKFMGWEEKVFEVSLCFHHRKEVSEDSLRKNRYSCFPLTVLE